MTNLSIKKTESAEVHKFLKIVSYSSRSLLRIINDILDFSKIEAGQLEIEHINFSLSEVLKNIAAMLHEELRSKGIATSLAIAEDVPENLIGDPTRLGQILVNLLSNAIKFAPQGDVSIDIRCLEHHGENVVLQFSVRDNGIGIAQEKITQLFDPFTQQDSSISRKFGGTGLGLSICKKLVDMQGGRIWVSSVEGEGSTFFFTLNFEAQKQVGYRAANESGHPREKGIFRTANDFIVSKEIRDLFRGCRVLLVEDNLFNQMLAKEILEGVDIKCEVAGNGIEALKCLDTTIDAVLMDVQMPEMDGLETTRRIRGQEEYADLPIIAMTAHALDDDKRKCLEAGMNDYLAKPFDPEEFLARLEYWIRKRSQQAIVAL